ncbi:thioredoxin [Halyomorpha halys]|uniref:thioredoxin n=1 Tax=Halyomorpha halys TaxID=286706 RepID=UPI0006D4EF84|nr:thioredoxin-like [Halyomorpha halys]
MVMIDIANGVQLGRIVYTSCDKLICLYFNANWAKPCDQIDPIVDRFVKLYPHVLFLRITAHVTPHLIPKQVRCCPTFHFVYNMAIVGGFEGKSPRKLNDHLFQLTVDPYSPVISSD